MLVLRDQAGSLHALRKDGDATFDKNFTSSLMPSYRDVFTDTELRDLLAYLLDGQGMP